MKPPARDISMRMDSAGSPGHGAAPPAAGPGARLSPGEFSQRLEAVRTSLWYIAAGVLGDRSEAEDAVQESAVTALSKLTEFDPATHFAAWMGQIVRNVARNYLHKRQRRRTTPAAAAGLDTPAPAATPDAVLTARGDLAPGQDAFDDQVSAALHRLEETARICLLLRTLADKPYREIASILGIPEGTAMSHVHRSRAALRQELGGGHRR
ncbi:MAG: RNA polymerase sigma factor [Phycisphaerales bacterium]|nr:RNA polymerase sigma factor [Phycisphaerales bacterium]